MSFVSPLHRQPPTPSAAAVRRRARAPVPQEPADPRCDYIPVPPVDYDDEGYPVEDSVGQNQTHSEQTTDWFAALRDWCVRHGLGVAFADLFMPYRQGQRNKVVCPDLMVALRADREEKRQSYKLWEHPLPDFVLEATSNSTWRADVEAKKQLYCDLKVREYWLFDPSGRRVPERLRGYRLQRRKSPKGTVDVYGQVRKNRSGRFESKVLKLELCVVDDTLRFHDPATGEFLRTALESQVRAREADAEKRRADEEQARADKERARAEHARAARQATKQQAAVEREAAESRIAELEAQLRALRQSD